MARHSKNNTSSMVFTYAERKKLKYGTITERIGQDSLKEFDACSLCLHPLVDPLACRKGHLFCKECIYEYLLTQKQEIARQMELYEQQEKRLKEEAERKKEEERLRELERLDRLQHGLEEPTPKRQKTENEERGEKIVVMEAITASGEKQEVTLIDRGKLNNFWVPGEVQAAKPALLKKPSTETMCPEDNHPIKLKELIKMNFTENKSKEAKHKYQCPVCCKSLSSAVKSVVIRKCGHAMCQNCMDKVKGDQACYVCAKKFKSKHVIPLQSGGTSYAGFSGEKLQPKVVTPAAWI